MALVFWVALLLLAHTYLLYPVSLVAWEALAQAKGALRYLVEGEDRRAAPRASFAPTVTLLVPAYNEEEVIDAKLDNSLKLDYPAEQTQILVGSDGSTDDTERLVLARQDGRIALSEAARGGKVAVLNRCIPMARGEIVVLTDANTEIDPKAIKRLVRHFEDPSVGAVVGRLRLYNRINREFEESLYWTYETWLKLYEGRHGAVLGANGGLYAIRRTAFEQLPPSTVVDDFVIPLRLLARGQRVLFDPEAVAYEETTEDYGKEFARRARIGAGDFASLSLLGGLLNPRRGFVAYAFWSHKLLRWCAPLLLAAMLLANLMLAAHSNFYRLLLLGQLGFYGLALLGGRPGLRGALRRAAGLARYFVSMNLALLVGFWRFLRGSQGAAWERTARS